MFDVEYGEQIIACVGGAVGYHVLTVGEAVVGSRVGIDVVGERVGRRREPIATFINPKRTNRWIIFMSKTLNSNPMRL